MTFNILKLFGRKPKGDVCKPRGDVHCIDCIYRSWASANITFRNRAHFECEPCEYMGGVDDYYSKTTPTYTRLKMSVRNKNNDCKFFKARPQQ